MIEHAVLSSIQLHGLAIGLESAQPMELRVLRNPLEFNDDSTAKLVLYQPQNFQFPRHRWNNSLYQGYGECKEECGGKEKVADVSPSDHSDARQSQEIP